MCDSSVCCIYSLFVKVCIYWWSQSGDWDIPGKKTPLVFVYYIVRSNTSTFKSLDVIATIQTTWGKQRCPPFKKDCHGIPSKCNRHSFSAFLAHVCIQLILLPFCRVNSPQKLLATAACYPNTMPPSAGILNAPVYRNNDYFLCRCCK